MTFDLSFLSSGLHRCLPVSKRFYRYMYKLYWYIWNNHSNMIHVWPSNTTAFVIYKFKNSECYDCEKLLYFVMFSVSAIFQIYHGPVVIRGGGRSTRRNPRICSMNTFNTCTRFRCIRLRRVFLPGIVLDHKVSKTIKNEKQ